VRRGEEVFVKWLRGGMIVSSWGALGAVIKNN